MERVSRNKRHKSLSKIICLKIKKNKELGFKKTQVLFLAEVNTGNGGAAKNDGNKLLERELVGFKQNGKNKQQERAGLRND